MRIEPALLASVLLLGAELTSAQGSYEYQDSVIVQRTVEEVMARPEFQRLREMESEENVNSAWLDRFFEWVEGFFSRDDVRREGGGGVGLAYGVALLIVVVVLAFIVKSILESAKERGIASDSNQAQFSHAAVAPGETPPEEYWARAQALAEGGNEKLALRELLLGVMSALERRGLIRHRRGLTNRDYFWAASGDARTSTGTIIAAFEQVYFGRREATATSFRECSLAYRTSFLTSTSAESDSTETPT